MGCGLNLRHARHVLPQCVPSNTPTPCRRTRSSRTTRATTQRCAQPQLRVMRLHERNATTSTRLIQQQRRWRRGQLLRLLPLPSLCYPSSLVLAVEPWMTVRSPSWAARSVQGTPDLCTGGGSCWVPIPGGAVGTGPWPRWLKQVANVRRQGAG